MTEVEHLADRPSWDCAACGRPWPCEPARERLTADHQHDQVALAMLLWIYFEAYVMEVGQGPATEAYQRFIGWSRRP